MHVELRHWTRETGWSQPAAVAADLVLYFAAPEQQTGHGRHGLGGDRLYAALRADYPAAVIAGCTTGGEILGPDVFDDSVVCVALAFTHGSRVRPVLRAINDPGQSDRIGSDLARALPIHDEEGRPLKGVFVLSDGTGVNGAALVQGLRRHLPADVLLTGGLAGDGPRFGLTAVGCNAPPTGHQVAALGFYGQALSLGWGSFGGWSSFGPERLITRSHGPILYELDGEPALDLYRRYLGEDAAALPGSALLFPLSIRPLDDPRDTTVRTIIGLNETDRSLTFAGDMPQGHVAKLMRGTFNGIIDGAATAAERVTLRDADLALLVSCIGRKLMLGQRVADEVEAVAASLGPGLPLAGFYSYGEIAPHGDLLRCDLHNQTMTITTIRER